MGIWCPGWRRKPTPSRKIGRRPPNRRNGAGVYMTEIEAEQLRNRVEELQALLGVGNDDVSRLLTVLDATPQQCEMVGFMLRRSVASRTALHTVLFGARPDCDQPEIKLIDVQTVRVRIEKGRRRSPDRMGLQQLGD